jgi:hypothetical protein
MNLLKVQAGFLVEKHNPRGLITQLKDINFQKDIIINFFSNVITISPSGQKIIWDELVTFKNCFNIQVF